MGLGGIQTFIMAMYRKVDRTKIQFDFLVEKEDPYFSDEIKKMGGHIYCISSRREGYSKYIKRLKDFFSEHDEYKIVHMHTSSLTNVEPLRIAKKHSVELRILHAHSSNIMGKFACIHKIFHKINKVTINRYCNKKIACSKEASEWMFGTTSGVEMFSNAVDSKLFIYDEGNRAEIRREFGISNSSVVLGCVGRFSHPKNHMKMIDIFSAFHKKDKESRLLLVGDGDLREQIEERVTVHNLENAVVFAGVRKDCFRFYSAFDVLVMPSLYEGLPVTLVEAQASNIPCIVSDTITRQVDFEGKIKYVSLDSDDEEWVDIIQKELKNTTRFDNSLVIADNLFDSNAIVEKILKIYNQAYKSEKDKI